MNSPIRTIQPTLCNGLKPNDIRGYKQLPDPAKRKARDRAIYLLQCMQLNRVETSILPPYLIQELWNTEVNYKDRRNFQLITEETFDGGTNFYIQNKS